MFLQGSCLSMGPLWYCMQPSIPWRECEGNCRSLDRLCILRGHRSRQDVAGERQDAAAQVLTGALMAKFVNPLNRVMIAAPCSADWDQMYGFGNRKVKFCTHCNLNVYNLSEMTRSEAEALITSTESRLCVRFYRRTDGTILTQNCPVGLKRIKRRVAWIGQVIHGIILALVFVLGLHNLSLTKRHFDAILPAPLPELRSDLPEPDAEMGYLSLENLESPSGSTSKEAAEENPSR